MRSSEGLAPSARALGRALEIAWVALLGLPGIAMLPGSLHWSRHDVAIAIAPLWLAIASRILWPGRAFFIASPPILVAGVACVAAPLVRGVDLLDLALQWRSYSAEDVQSALQPYLAAIVAACVVMSGLCLWTRRLAPSRTPARGVRIGTVGITLLAASVVPVGAWPQVWPAKPALVAVSSLSSMHRLARWLYPEAVVGSQRDPDVSWNGALMPDAPPAETVVLLIGEAVRADYLAECGGPPKVRRVIDGARIACDVTASSDQTATSVPLLVSRQMPGQAPRAFQDATFQRALKEAGYETHWYAVQNRGVAYPDADIQQFAEHLTPDASYLLPRLAAALARPAPRKSIVLHAYNAHEPYCARFRWDQAPYPVDCPSVTRRWDKARITEMRQAYADAVDASVELVNEVIGQLRARQEPAFLVFVPDHGDNLMDDGRDAFGHARRAATRWDIQVPAIFWANDAWRSRHAAQWNNLAAQVVKPLMHADIVPTLLDAADVRYQDRRPSRVDLLVQAVPERDRIIQAATGVTVSWSTLVAEARAAAAMAAGR